MKFKKLLILGLVGLMVVTSTPVVSPPISVEAASTEYIVERTQIGTSNCYWKLTSDGVLEITGEGDPKINANQYVKIPWYENRTNIKEVNIESSVKPTNMTFWFYECTNLIEAPEIPNSVTDCERMFDGCTNLIEAPEIPNSVTGCSYMFRRCTNLTEAPVIPNSVTDCEGMFCDCSSLVEAPEIPNSVTDCDDMFCGCTSLVEAPEIPNSVTDCAFMFIRCTNLKEAPEIPNSVTDCGRMFDGCTNLIEAPEIPNSVTSCFSMFEGCISLTKAPEIPNSITDCDDMFRGCTSLTEAPEIPNSVTECEGMFDGCTNLIEAPEIPNSITDCDDMFRGCTSLKSVVIKANPTYYSDMFKNAGTPENPVTLYYSGNCTEEIANKLASTGTNVVTKKYELYILEQPKDKQVIPNTEVTFEVDAFSVEKTYQWYMSSDKITDGVKLTGATSPTYTIKASDVTKDLNGKYFYCIFTNEEGDTVTSDRAKLSVVTAPTTPTFSANINSGTWTNRVIDLELIGSNLLGDTTNIAYKYSTDGGVTWKDYSDIFSWNTDTTGTTIKAKAYSTLYPDQFSEETNFIVKFDGTAPVVNDYSIQNNSITLTATDNTSGVAGYALTTSKNQPSSKDWVSEPIIEINNAGTYYGWAMDRAGNVSACSEPITVLDTFKYGDIVACGQTVTYDGNSYSGYVETELDGVTITYGMTEGVYDLTEAPSFTNVGEYIVYFKAEKDGYEPLTGECYVIINKASTQDKPSTPQTQDKPSTPQTPNTPQSENKKDNSAEIVKVKNNKASIKKLKNTKGKKIQVKIKKQSDYKYEVQVSTSKKFKKSVKKYSTSKTTYTVKKLKKGKKYYVRVRTYKVIDGKKVYGKWSSTKSIKIKK